MSDEIELARLQLERDRLAADIRRNELDVELKRQEVRQQHEHFTIGRRDSWKQVYSPLGVAILAGIIGLGSTIYTGFQNLRLEREKQRAAELLERQRQEAALLLKLAEQPDERLRARNLLFFAEGKYLTLPANYIQYLRKVAGLDEGQQIPPPSLPTATGRTVTTDTRYAVGGGPITLEVIPNLHFDSATTVVTINGMPLASSRTNVFELGRGSDVKGKRLVVNTDAALFVPSPPRITVTYILRGGSQGELSRTIEARVVFAQAEVEFTVLFE